MFLSTEYNLKVQCTCNPELFLIDFVSHCSVIGLKSKQVTNNLAYTACGGSILFLVKIFFPLFQINYHTLYITIPKTDEIKLKFEPKIKFKHNINRTKQIS